jgi:hypothetical protein
MADKNRDKHQGWIASLSDGTTVFEEPPVQGERTAWGKVVDRCAEDPELYVTQIQLQIGGRTIVGIKGARGYCTFVDYRAEGFQASNDGRPAKEVRHVGIGSVVENTVYCTLINEQGQSWQDSRSLASMSVHCVLKPAS